MGLILLFSLVPMLIVFSSSLGHSPISAIIGFGALIVAFWSLLIGPQVLRHDFRNDLQVADILKALPMRGWQVVLGELLAPAMQIRLHRPHAQIEQTRHLFVRLLLHVIQM
jgi:hypothetical protein